MGCCKPYSGVEIPVLSLSHTHSLTHSECERVCMRISGLGLQSLLCQAKPAAIYKGHDSLVSCTFVCCTFEPALEPARGRRAVGVAVAERSLGLAGCGGVERCGRQ